MASAQPVSSPLLEADFAERLLRHFGTGNEWLCVQHREHANTPVAACILTPRGGGRWASFMPAQAQLGLNLLGQGADLHTLFRALPGTAQQIDFLGIDPHLVEVDVLDGGALAQKQHALTIGIDFAQGFDAWWSSRSPNLRANLRRYRHRLEKEGVEARFDVHSGPAQIAQAVRRYAALESAGWKSQAGTAVREGADQFEFYVGLMTDLAVSGRAQMHELWLGDRLAASRMLVEEGHTVVPLKTTHDEDLRRYAPGILLLENVIRRSFETHDAGRFEFYTNARPDQLAWATHQRHVLHLTAWRSNVVRHLADAYRRVSSRSAPPSAFGTWVDTHDDLRSLPSDAESLLRRSGAHHPWQSPHWLQTLANSSNGGAEVEWQVLRSGGHVQALWPVRVMQDRIEGLEVGTPVDSSLVVADDWRGSTLAPMFEALLKRHPTARRIDVGTLPTGDPLLATLRGDLRECGLLSSVTEAPGVSALRLPPTWSDFLKRRSQPIRERLDRAHNQARSAGLHLDILARRADVATAQAAMRYLAIHSPSGALDDISRASQWLILGARRGWMRFGVARLGDAVIDAQLWFVASGYAMKMWWQGDPAYRSLGATDLLTAELMKHFIECDRAGEARDLSIQFSTMTDWMDTVHARQCIAAATTRSALDDHRPAPPDIYRSR